MTERKVSCVAPAMLWAALIIVSGVLTAIGLAVRRHWGGYPPLGVILLLLVVVCVTAAYFVVPLAMSQGSGSPGAMVGLCGGLLVAFPPIAIAGRLLAGSIGHSFTRNLMASSLISPQPSDYGKARACVVQEDITGALREYRNYYRESPKVPAPLFASARLLERYDRHEEAVTYYQEIIRTFEKQRTVWAEASLALASVYENHLGDVKTADYLLGLILRRARDLEQGRVAGARVARRLHQ